MFKKSIALAYGLLVLLIPLFALSYKIFFQKNDLVISIPNFYDTTVREKTYSDLSCFVFSDEQKKAVERFFYSNGDAALLIQLKPIKVKNASSDDAILSYGFLSEKDISFLGNAKSLSESLSSNPVVTDSLAKYSGKSFALSLCVDKDKPLPKGFFIRSSSRYLIESAQIIRACIGHDFSGAIPVFAFAPNGGLNRGSDDFGGASMVFSSVNTKDSLMPVFQLRYGDEKKEASVRKIAFGGEVITIRTEKSSSLIEIPSGALKNPFSPLTSPDGSPLPQSVMLVASDRNLLNFASESKNVLSPIKCDPGLIMNWPRNNWRGNDYELFEWDRFSNVLIFDFSTYEVQDDFLRRMAFFVEKKGFKGRLLSDEELDGMHAYNAHDYRAESLAAFFDKAQKENFPLNSREKLLKRILQENKIIISESDGSVSAGKGALISISQESPSYLRTTFVAHEGWHGIFFVDDDFRNAVSSIYYTMDQKSLAYLRRYFQVTPSLNYDVNDDYLMKNEFMAYMLQRPLSAVNKYYVDAASRPHSQTYAKNEADYIIETNAVGFEGAAVLLDQYVNDRWSLNAGRVWMLSR